MITPLMESPLVNIPALLLEREDMDAGVVSQIRDGLSESTMQYASLKESAQKLDFQLSEGKGNKAMLKLKAGIAWYLVGYPNRASELLSDVQTPLGKFYLGLAYVATNNYGEAYKAFDSAGKAGYAASQVEIQKAGALRGKGDTEKAQSILDSLEEYVHGTPEYLYQYGELLIANGMENQAIGYFERTLDADPRHAGALFQLAYHNDKYGNDDEAISLYERCLENPPPRLGTLINLGILYEDHEKYDRAVKCFEKVLEIFPNHPRARLYFKDALHSRKQFFDEDAQKRNDSYMQILEVPVSDFELSVRSRNCLKKMDIHTLGDLVNTSEQQLLASKNFGETSLHEIKEMLTMKGLHLGQGLESKPKRIQFQINPEELTPEEQAMYSRPVSDLNFSVRARKCMNRLGITTIGELVAHSGDELLESKNFGVTSLVEVRDKLTGIDMKLRGD